MIFRSGFWALGLLFFFATAAGCATGAGGGTYSGDDGGGAVPVDGSMDALGDGASEGGSRDDAAHVADGNAAQDTGPDVTQEAAGDDGSQEASTGTDAPADVAPADSSDGDAGNDGGGTDGGGTCNAQSCIGGCCQGNDCVTGTMDNACGTTGGACQDCTALGDTCVSGACQAPSSNCSTTCAGCCDANDACHATSSAQYCFTNGGNPFQAGGPCEDCKAEGFNYCVLDIFAYICSPIP